MSQDPVQVIAESTFFDAEWYLRTYPDVRHYHDTPVEHYIRFGAQIARAPGPGFDGAAYLRRYPEVAEAGHNPLWHYELFGKHEGRETLPPRCADRLSDAAIAASVMNRTRARPLQRAAEVALAQTFAARLTGKPDRFFTEFDAESSRLFVGALDNRTDAERAVRESRVSVIMPAFNRARTLARAVRSVLGQSHQNLELIVVDDGSTDYTPDVAAKFSGDPRFTYLRAPHRGVSAARNLGLKKAGGEVIFYLDTDNVWTRDFLRLMLIALRESGARCGYAATQLLVGDHVAGYRGEPFDWSHSLNGNYVDLNVFCHQRSLTKNAQAFDENLRRMVDWDLILRLTRKHPPVFCPFIGCLYSDDSGDPSRISTSTPYIFERIVSHRHALGFDSLAEALADVRFSVALKRGSDEDPLADNLAEALRAGGHRARVDGPEAWRSRHPHEDEIVVTLKTATDFIPHPEQFTLACGSTAPAAAYHGSIEQAAPEAMARQVMSVVERYLLGENPPS